MALVALKCPNCGALIPRESMKCQYCGAGLILAPNGLTLLPQKQNSCPKCGHAIASDAWFCIKCMEVITKDVEHLSQIRKKVMFQQEDLKRKMEELQDKIEPNEFIYFLFWYKGIFSNKYYAATEKKLMKFDYNQYWQAPLSEIVSVGTPKLKGYNYTIEVQTFDETVTLDFGENNCWDFHRSLSKAIDDYTLQRRDIRAILCSLKMP